MDTTGFAMGIQGGAGKGSARDVEEERGGESQEAEGSC
jgi:hypothetical protein